MECIICGKDSQGKTCSGSCRAKLSRQSADRQAERTRTVEAHAHEPERTVAHEPERTVTSARPMNWGLIDCECQHCQTVRANSSKHTINHGAWKPALELDKLELNRVTMPGDVDYSTRTASTEGQAKAIAATC